METHDEGSRLNKLLVAAGLAQLDNEKLSRFESYLSLFVRWNERLNLSAVRDEEGIISRHFIESIDVAYDFPRGIATLLDFGSGAGLPGIPIALCRPEIAVTLAESLGKKAAFLQEAVRVLGLKTEVYAGRAEAICAVFDCVILRAVDKMPKAVASATRLVGPEGWLALMTTTGDLEKLKHAAGRAFRFQDPRLLPNSTERVLALARRTSAEPGD